VICKKNHIFTGLIEIIYCWKSVQKSFAPQSVSELRSIAQDSSKQNAQSR